MKSAYLRSHAVITVPKTAATGFGIDRERRRSDHGLWFPRGLIGLVLAGYDKQPVEVRSLGIEARQKLRLIGGRFRQIETNNDAISKSAF